ncbi:hypothetical protein SLA2020_122920 [Shorea laevis]
MMCGLCKKGMEDVDHLFCTCMEAWLVWAGMIKWWGMEVVMPNIVKGVAEIFICGLGSLASKEMAACIFLVTTWYLWYWRNVLVFRREEGIREQLLELIQVKTHFWVRNKGAGCVFSLVQWQSNPMECARELKQYKKSLKKFNQQQK